MSVQQCRGDSQKDTPPTHCGPLCGPRISTTLPPSLSSSHVENHESKRRRLWGLRLRGLVKVFRRKVRRKTSSNESASQPPEPTLRTRATSELAMDQGIKNPPTGPYNQGLSVSHDSVFSPESPPDGHRSPPLPHGLAIASRGVDMLVFQSELKAVLSMRKTDYDSLSGDDDPGLPRSPPTSPTTVDVLSHGLKSYSRVTQSSCSDGSLLSMGSSDIDEDSFGGSHYSSKLSLEGRLFVIDNEPAAGAAPLNHQAAHHKISVKPRRSHPVSRGRRAAQVVSASSLLPATPELNEDSRSVVSSDAVPPSSRLGDSSRGNDSVASDSVGGPEKGDGDKKEEPLFSRIFSSKRVSRKLSRGRSNEREGSTSPQRKRDRSSSSKERRDSSGGCLGFHLRTSPKRQRKTDLQDSLSCTVDDCSAQHSKGDDVKSESGRSVSAVSYSSHAELGRTEDLSPRRSSKIFEGNSTRISNGEQTSSPEGNLETSSRSSSFSLENSSCDSQDRVNKVQRSPSCESRRDNSSCENLTSTPLPGVYIRNNRKGLDDQLLVNKYVPENDISGPASLDSDFDKVEKMTTDVPEKPSSTELLHNKPYQTAVFCADAEFCPSPAVSSRGNSAMYEEAMRIFDSKCADSSHKPSSRILRSKSVQESEGCAAVIKNRRDSSGDELEKERRRSLLRPLNREASSKQSEACSVPEFLKIQLNKVENRAFPVVYDTSEKTSSERIPCSKGPHETAPSEAVVQENAGPSDRAGSALSKIPAENLKAPLSLPKATGDPPKQSVKDKTERVNTGRNNNKYNSTEMEKGSHSPGYVERTDKEGVVPDVVPRQQGYDGSHFTRAKLDTEKIDNKTTSGDCEKAKCFEGNYRIYSHLERSESATTSHPVASAETHRDQPELLMVFARRSFKVKDEVYQEDPPGEPQHTRFSIAPFSALNNTTGISGKGVDQIADMVKTCSSSPNSGEHPCAASSRSTSTASVEVTPLADLSFGNASAAQVVLDAGPVPVDKNTSSSPSALCVDRSASKSPCDSDRMTDHKQTDSEVTDKDSLKSATKPAFSRVSGSAVQWPLQVKQDGKAQSNYASEQHLEAECMGAPPLHLSDLQSSEESADGTEEETEDASTFAEQESIDVSIVRRRFMSERAGQPQEAGLNVASFSGSKSAGIAEARNTMPAFTVTVRTTQSPKSGAANATTGGDLEGRAAVERPDSRRESTGSSRAAAVSSAAAEDWRSLVRQRREDRLKNAKLTEAEEALAEQPRPASSRNSKVLEIASNFQKLQVA